MPPTRENRLAIAKAAMEWASQKHKRPNRTSPRPLSPEEQEHEVEMIYKIDALDKPARTALDEWVNFAKRNAQSIMAFPIAPIDEEEPDRSGFLADQANQLIPLVSRLNLFKVDTELLAYQTAQKLKRAYEGQLRLPYELRETHAQEVIGYVRTHFLPPQMPRTQRIFTFDS